MITMSEIAKLAHVSQSTVSRVLNGSLTVDPVLRERVLACAQEHDYQFNALAQSLQGSKTMLLGVLVTDISNGFFADLAKAIEGEARKQGYSMILFNSDGDSEKEQFYLDITKRYRVDGVIAVPILQDNLCWPSCIDRLDVPAVAVTRRVEGLDSVYLDHWEASGLVAQRMLEQGCKRFLFVGQKDSLNYSGFQAALLEQTVPEAICCLSGLKDNELRESLQAFFPASGPRTGIFAHNDVCALRVLSALRDVGVSVPERAVLIGFDDTFMGRYLHPALTSVSQPIPDMAREAVACLLARMEHPQRPPADCPLHAALVIRESG